MTRHLYRTSLLPAMLFSLLILAACEQTAVPSAPPSTPAAVTPLAPTPAPALVATPFPTEGIAGSNSLAYNLGQTTITQPDVVAVADREMPIPLLGTISIPEGEGPFPVALVLHGRHTRCYSDPAQTDEVWPCEPGAEPRYDSGFSYLLDALAARGYLAVAPSINGAYTTVWGMPEGTLDEVQPVVDARLIAIVEAHLTRLAAAGGGEPIFGERVDLTGKVDLTRTALIGHSTAGTTANQIAREGLLPVRALLLLASMQFTTAGDTAGMPTAVLLSACDSDRSDLPAQGYYENGRLDDRTTPLASVMLEGANHNFYNQELVAQGIDDGFFSRNPSCADFRLTAEEQQAFLAAFATDLIDAGFGRPGDQPASFLVIDGPAPTALYGRPVQSALAPPAVDRVRLLVPPAGAGESPPGSVTGPVVAAVCAPNEPCVPDMLQPGNPGQVKLSWDGPGAVYRLALPAEAADATTAGWLRLRVAIDPVDPRSVEAAPVSFGVLLTDAAGASVRLPLPQPLPFPALSTYEGDGYRFTPVLPVDVRLPLDEAAQAIDLSSVASVALLFDETAQGSIHLADLEWLVAP